MASTLTLHSMKLSGNSYKARLLASLLSVPLQIKEVNIRSGELKKPEYLAVNPRGQLPALVVADGPTLNDSAAILTYLASNYSDAGEAGKGPSSFWSTDAAEQAQIVDWLSFSGTWINTGLSPARFILKFGGQLPPGTLEASQAKARRSLEILDAVFAKQDWVAVAARPTIADIAVFPYVDAADESGVPLEAYPSVRAWIARVRALPKFVEVLA